MASRDEPTMNWYGTTLCHSATRGTQDAFELREQ